MPSDRFVLERQMADVELRPFTLDEFHRRRHRKRRNRRITTAVLGLVLAAAAVGGVLRSVEPDSGDQTITAGPGNERSNPFVGAWESTDADGSRQTMEIDRSNGEGAYEIRIRYDAIAACSGAAATMTGTGRRETGTGWRPGLVELVVAAEMTCDDGSTPSLERGQQEALGAVRFLEDPATGDLIGPSTDPGVFDSVDHHSLEVAWRRPGAEPHGGDPSATIDRLVDAVNAGDREAFTSVFAPDGQFHPRGFASLGSMGTPVAAPDARAWMAVQEAWGFEADVRTCQPVSPPPTTWHRFSASSDTWIECDVAARWANLLLEITDQWRFELRGTRLVGWSVEVLDLDPAERELPLGYPGLEAWEAWLVTAHPDDAARLLAQRDLSPQMAIGCDDPVTTMCGFAERTWEIDGYGFAPTNLIPYDPALAGEIEASILDYLEDR